jgi:hypothetical protein
MSTALLELHEPPPSRRLLIGNSRTKPYPPPHPSPFSLPCNHGRQGRAATKEGGGQAIVAPSMEVGSSGSEAAASRGECGIEISLEKFHSSIEFCLLYTCQGAIHRETRSFGQIAYENVCAEFNFVRKLHFKESKEHFR